MCAKLEFTPELIEKFFFERGELLSKDFRENTRYTLQTLMNNLPNDQEITSALISKTLQRKKPLARTSLKAKLTQVKCYVDWLLGHFSPESQDLYLYKKGIKTPKDEPRAVSAKTIKKMIDKLPLSYRFLLFVGSLTAARRTALVNLNLENLKKVTLLEVKNEFEEDTYQKLMTQYSAETKIYKITRYEKLGGEKAKKEITVKLGVQETLELELYLEKRIENEQYYFKKYGRKFEDEKGSFIFWNRRGFRMKAASASAEIYKTAKSLGIDFQLHDLRRFTIQSLYYKGVRKETIKEISGHDKESNCIDRYLHIDEKTVSSELYEAGWF